MTPTKQNKKQKEWKNVCAKEKCKNTHTIFHTLLCKHITHIHKHGHKLLHLTEKYNHHLTHIGELILVSGIIVTNFISAGFTPNPSTQIITDHTIIAKNLITAEQKGAPSANASKIISMRTMDSSINNSFYPWYCTYGAARISPEFFPFIDPSTQQRTWWGNAIDRCENAQATGYTIWSKPTEWALIVYGQWWAGGVFGHVGKVMYYNASRQSLIIRDMNRVNKFTMTDRRENAENPNIKCFIYNKKITTTVAINDIPPVNTSEKWQISWPSPDTITENNVHTTGATIQVTTNNNTTPTEPWLTQPTTTNNPSTNTTTNNNESPITSTTTENLWPQTNKETQAINEDYSIENIDLNFDAVSDLAKHFLTQRNVKAELAKKETVKIWDTITLTLTIKDPNTQAGYEWLLDLPIELIASNDNIQTNYSLIQLIKNGKIDITITAKNGGDTTLLINFDGEKIWRINLTVK